MSNPNHAKKSAIIAGTLFLAVMWPHTAAAAPFDREFTFPLPNGQSITLHGQGDDFSAIFETLDGYTVVFDRASRLYHYAVVGADGRLTSSGSVAGEDKPAAAGIVRGVRPNAKVESRDRSLRSQLWEQETGIRERWNALKAEHRAFEAALRAGGPVLAPSSSTTVGNKVGLTLLVDFSDQIGSIPKANVEGFVNGDGYTGYGNNGSVKAYYYDNSAGVLTYTNVVVGYIRVPKTKAYYDDSVTDCGIRGRELLQDAITAMKAWPNYNSEIVPLLNTLTVDNSNRAVACNVYYAGTVSSPWTYGLWPHSWALASAVELWSGGKKVYRYQITDMGSSLVLGTFCHENGHMLCGFPDLYDYGYDSAGGAGQFSLMDYGGHGTNPAQVDAYLKLAAGWATLVTDITNGAYTVRASSGATRNEFLRLVNPVAPDTEYFLIENRQATGRDANLPASGIAVWHVDELGNRDDQRTACNTSHQNYELSLEQADGLFHFQSNTNSGDSRDLFYQGNGASGYTNMFTNATTPSAKWWNCTDSELYLHSFSTPGANMTLTSGSTSPVIAAAGSSLSSESCTPANGTPDPAETVTVSFSLRNIGTVNAIDLVATLQPTGGVTSPSGPQSYGALIAGGAAVAQPFTFTASGSCGSTITATLQLQDGSTNLGTATFTYTLGVATVVFAQNFDSVTAPALPAGWTATVASGSVSPWATTSSVRDTVPNSVFASDAGSVSDNRLDSPSIPIDASPGSLTFRHSYNVENTYDGAVLEISIAGGAFTDIISAGGSFVGGGYVGTIDTGYSNPIGGRQAWTGSSGGFITTTVNLPASAAGHNIQLRWRMASDSTVGGTGWYVDTISIIGGYTCCIPCSTALAISSAVSRKTHGTSGTYDVPSGSIEGRLNGPTQIVATFNQPVHRVANTATDFTLSSGTLGTVTVAGALVTVNVSGVTDKAIFTIGFPGIASDCDNTTTTATKCWKVLQGDVNGISPVNNLDVLAIRGMLGQVTNGSSFTRDVNYTNGRIDNLDMLFCRSKLGSSVSGACTP